MNTIRDHLNEVRENIQKACEKQDVLRRRLP